MKSLPITRRDSLKLGTGALFAGALGTAGTAQGAAAPRYGLEPYPVSDAVLDTYPAFTWLAEGPLYLPSRDLGREAIRNVILQGYPYGSGRIAFSAPDRVHGQLWPERPFVAARLDPSIFQAFWLGLFAESPHELMP